ncbi:hypothetical protein NQ314_006424 [Rhamnusium bicolor]|uniref:DDE Tnp4 domain-containing protein n=1 Tax=Rhamnusium bicolor TaxID=1586634 RepID=A0AAV8Z4V9_9CUCU|nr:hypothetical protein NQ314_006424 [Rhamnusium bicolor]
MIRPPSVSTSEKSTKATVKESKRIAALRIHIERVIRRIREFHMLKMHSCVNHKILYLFDYIVIIVCGLINTQDLIIK